MSNIFRVGVTRDFLKADGSLGFGDIGLSMLDASGVEWEFLGEDVRELRPEHARDYDGLLVLAPRVTAATLAGGELNGGGRLCVIARFGVGYDNVDVATCTEHGVLVTITPDGVRRPVAVAALTLLLALSHKLLIKDRLTRAGRWAEKLNHLGQGVSGRTLGVIGLGNIGREVFTIAQPLGMRHVGYDPFVDRQQAASFGVEWLELEDLLATADYVCICCALTPDTRHLLNADRLERMKSNAYLINVARGPIVDQAALTTALQEGRIAGAGLDVFEQEPLDPADPLLSLDNVIVAPHAICWTDECFGANGRSACQSLLDVAAGRTPKHVVNRAALEHPRLRQRLARP